MPGMPKMNDPSIDEEDFDDFLSRIDAVGEISLARPLSRHGACRESGAARWVGAPKSSRLFWPQTLP